MSNPWGSLEFLILGRSAETVERLRSVLARLVPEVSAFTSYEKAFDHAKARRTVGFLILLDDLEDVPAGGAAEQLAKHYEAKGWPCPALALRAREAPTWDFALALFGGRFIGCAPVADFLDVETARPRLDALRAAHARLVEEHLIPQPLAQALRALARPRLDAASQRFIDRVVHRLAADEGLDWLGLMAARWQPVLAALEPAQRAACAGALDAVARLAEEPGAPAATAARARELDAARREGRLAAAGADEAILRLAAEAVRADAEEPAA